MGEKRRRKEEAGVQRNSSISNKMRGKAMPLPRREGEPEGSSYHALCNKRKGGPHGEERGTSSLARPLEEAWFVQKRSSVTKGLVKKGGSCLERREKGRRHPRRRIKIDLRFEPKRKTFLREKKREKGLLRETRHSFTCWRMGKGGASIIKKKGL